MSFTCYKTANLYKARKKLLPLTFTKKNMTLLAKALFTRSLSKFSQMDQATGLIARSFALNFRD